MGLGIEQEIEKRVDINGDPLYLGAELYKPCYRGGFEKVYIVGFNNGAIYISYSKLGAYDPVNNYCMGSFMLDFTPLLVNPKK